MIICLFIKCRTIVHVESGCQIFTIVQPPAAPPPFSNMPLSKPDHSRRSAPKSSRQNHRPTRRGAQKSAPALTALSPATHAREFGKLISRVHAGVAALVTTAGVRPEWVLDATAYFAMSMSISAFNAFAKLNAVPHVNVRAARAHRRTKKSVLYARRSRSIASGGGANVRDPCEEWMCAEETRLTQVWLEGVCPRATKRARSDTAAPCEDGLVPLPNVDVLLDDLAFHQLVESWGE